MNTAPFRTNGIENPDLLFGRQEELQNLCDYAEGLHQVEIIGARRFGKTCLVKSFISFQKEAERRKVYPVFLDPYSDGIRGTANVYRYLTAQVISNLYIDKYLNDTILTLDDYKIAPNKKWEKVYKQLENVADEIDQICMFDEAVECFSEQIEQKILLIFDEYEKAVDAFDKIDGLLHIRQLSGKSSNPIIFWIVGASPWKKFIEGSNKDVRGSGVFNGVTQNQKVRPIGLADFSKMWKHECSLIQDESKRMFLESLMEKVYESSGGVPCFAKEIGATTYVEGDFPQYNRLSNHFAEIEKNLTDGEMKCLRSLVSSPKEYVLSEVPKSITELEDYGLIKKDKQERYVISCRFFADYIRAGLFEEQNIQPDNNSIEIIVREIKKAFYNINDKWHALHGRNMFDPTNDTQLLYDDLSLKCDSREKAPNFINSIYLLYWEGAKEDKAGEKIPDQFKWTMFRKSMDRIRHILGKAHQQDKLDQSTGQIDKASALKEIWGDPTEPQSPIDWLHFQECMLNKFLQELNDLYEFIRKGRNAKSSNTSLASNNPKVVSGIFKKGDFGRKDVIEQDYWGNIHEVRSIRKGEVVKDGDKVEYTLCREPNRNPKWDWFWYAEDVHIKRQNGSK